MSRRLLRVGIAFALVATATGFGVWHHLNGARFEISAAPIPTRGRADCIAEVASLGNGGDFCQNADGQPWYHAFVRNAGGRGAWVVTCTLEAFDTEGRPIPGLTAVDVPMWLTQPGMGARPHLDPGQSASLDWFLPSVPTSKVGSYTGSCTMIVYRHPPV